MLHISVTVKIFGNNNHSGICPDHNWVPPHGVRKPMPDPNLLFHEGSILRYVCDNGYELSPPNGTQKCHNGIWTPSRLPNCVPVSGTFYSIHNRHKIKYRYTEIRHLLNFAGI